MWSTIFGGCRDAGPGTNHEEGSMRAFAQSLLVLLIVGLAAGKLSSQTAPTRVVTAAEYESWKKDLSNWGRWGKDDQIGALNLITPAKRREAAGLVTEGFSVSLASDADIVKAVDNPKSGIFTRGVLLDIPRLKGVPYLEPGTPIYIEDLEAWERQAGVKVGAGDALFVRTGVWARRKEVGPWLRGRAEGGRSAGLDPSVHPLAQRTRHRHPRQ